ncbi:MAG: topoisomerase DNA-binding C4 zinc finger domain-containing protein [Syntrophorhabdaceae bacterium]|nr:topoisomerase DNA-binding C4 zinc finger domain-containing protein [Syntrophorhabdaceae bacterium]MDD5243485.1 topoisomerase DNA-binding C4 zinc finger domain-containing protein [Syntrophorhabdaceae bacterium]
MQKRDEGIVKMLLESPWWVSIIVAFIAYIGIKFIIPSIIGGSPLFKGVAILLSSFAIWVALFFLVIGAISALFAWRRGELLTGLTSVKTIRRQVQTATTPKDSSVSESPRTYAEQKVICPICGSNMVLRKATRGVNAGKNFWGCEKFPSCRGIRNIKE